MGQSLPLHQMFIVSHSRQPSTSGRTRIRGMVGLAILGACIGLLSAGLAPAATRLTDGSEFGGMFGRFCQISPDGTRVVFTADVPGAGLAALYSAPIGGGGLSQLSGPTIIHDNYLDPDTGDYYSLDKKFEITCDSQSVIYTSEPSLGTITVNKVAIAGGASTALGSLSGDVPTAGFATTADGAHVVYGIQTGSIQTVYSAPASGGTPALLFSTDVGGQSSFVLSPRGDRVLYWDDQNLLMAPIGGGPVTTIDTAPDGWTVGYPQFTADGQRVLYTMSAPPVVDHPAYSSYSYSVSGGNSVLLGSGSSGFPLGFYGGWVGSAGLIAGNTGVISAFTSTPGLTQFSRLDTATGASTPLGVVTSDISREYSCQTLRHDAAGALYLGTDRNNVSSLWYVSFAGGTPTRLSGDVAPIDPTQRPFGLLWMISSLLTPDDATAVYAIEKTSGEDIYSVPSGGGASVRLNADPASGMAVLDYNLTPDGRYLVYSVGIPQGLATTFPPVDDNGIKELYAVDVLGGTPWLLSDSLADGQFIREYEIGPDGTVVYWAGSDAAGYDLFSTPVPEPATLTLVLAGLALLRRSRRR